ncbi:MAG: flavodoxin domain-containing protein [Candidatus Izemoplasmatales bacterium]|jgi:flavodoxin|nr:flavodoxin domain-containing protein [Candidatus Izemoplasmatales bacterium]
MKIGILYGSMTGHSKKIASAIGEAIKVEPQNVKTKPEFKKLDLLIVIGGIYGGVSHKGLLQYLNSLNKESVKQAALITSCCSGSQRQDRLRSILEEKGIPVMADEYVCCGNFLIFRLGHPNKAEIQGAVDYVKKIIAKLSLKKETK